MTSSTPNNGPNHVRNCDPNSASEFENAPSHCAVCLSSDFLAYAEKNGCSFIQCASCDYIFCHPRPTQEQLNEIYRGGDEEGAANEDFFPKASSRRRRAFFNALKLRRYIRDKRSLDLGCGGGFFADAARLMGGDSHGLDVNGEAIAYARRRFQKCEFHLGSFENFRGKVGNFDFVYSSEVIEHLNDVEDYMDFLSSVMRPDGVVFITTPDIEWTGGAENPVDWDVFSPPIHIQFFCEKTLVRLFRRYDFVPLRRVPDSGAGLKMLFRKQR